MSRQKAGAFFSGCLVGAMTIWLFPYNELVWMNVNYRIITAGLALVFSFFFRLFSAGNSTITGVYLAFGILCCVGGRILLDVIINQKAHELWAVEVMLLSSLAFPPALVGAYLASLLASTKSRKY